MRTFASFTEAKEYAERTVRKLAKGDQAAALSPQESTDALALRAALDAFRRDTGKTVSALEAVKSYLDATRKLGEHSLTAAVAGFHNGVASVQRPDVREAVTESLQTREPLTRSANGERPQLSSKDAYNLEIMLRRFADTFPRHCALRPDQDPSGRLRGRARGIQRQDSQPPPRRRAPLPAMGRPQGLPRPDAPPG